MTKDLTTGHPLKVILWFAFPLVLGNLFQQFYNLADTIIVGRFVGVNALAAVGSTGSINYMILGFVIGICNGFAIPIAQYFGARSYGDMRRYVANSAWLSLAGAVVLTVATVLLTRPILQLMQTPADIVDDAAVYIGWIFAGIPFVFLYNMVSCIMRALGDSKTPLVFLVVTSFLNIGLDLLFILVFDAGVMGAALATDLSQAISGIASLLYLCKRFDVLKMKKEEAGVDRAACGRLLYIGLPMGLQCSITAIGSVVMQWAVNVLGSTVVAAVTAASKTSNLLTVPLESVGTAMATYAGQNLGASRLDRVRSGVRYALGIVAVYAVGSLVVLHFFDVTIFGLFIDTATEIEIVEQPVLLPAGRAHCLALCDPGTWIFRRCHDGGRCRDGCPYGCGTCACTAAWALWRRTGQSGSMDRGLRVPDPRIPVDDPPYRKSLVWQKPFSRKLKNLSAPICFEIKKSEKRQNLDYEFCLFCFESGLFASGKLGLFKKIKKRRNEKQRTEEKKRGGEKTFSKNAKKSKKGVDFAEMLCYNYTRRRETDLPTTENLGV